MRVLVGAALLVLAILSLTSAWAIQSAVVTSAQVLTVVSTSDALLSLTPGADLGNAAGTARYRDPVAQDSLVLDFRRGWDSGQYGLTGSISPYPNRFRYRGLFTVTNRSASTQCVSVFVPNGGAPDLSGIRVRTPGDTGSGAQVAGAGGAFPTCQALGPSQSFEVDFWWEVVSATPFSGSFNVRVEGVRA